MPSQTEIRIAITNQIVEALTKGGLPPWRRPWRPDHNCGTPANMSSGRNYSGVNPLLLGLAADRHGFQSRWWATFNQWSQMGGSVKRRPGDIPSGKWGTQIVFYRPVTKTNVNGIGEEEEEKFFILRSYTVFNLDQVDGPFDKLRAGNAPYTVVQLDERHDEARRVIATTEADIRHGGDRAYYCPGEDAIHLPHPQQFVTPEAYFETALHELVHWCEHSARLNWDRTDKENTYALGELVAEIGACYLMTEIGLPTAETWQNAASYLQNWLRAMGNDPRFIFKASSQASRAADFVLSRSRQLLPESEVTVPF